MADPLWLIKYAFQGPASLGAWSIVLLTLFLIFTVPVLSIVVREKWGYLSALGVSLLPLIIGIAGTLYSLSYALQALKNIPAARHEQMMAAGLSVSLCTSFLGSLATSFLWIIAVLCFAIVFLIRRRRGSDQKAEKTPGISLHDRFVMLSISTICMPALLGGVGWLYGTILKCDTIANVPAARRALETAASQSIILTSAGAGILLTLAGVVGCVVLVRRKSSA